MTKTEYKVLLELFESYCSVMCSEFDFPGKPWTPERDKDKAALNAQTLLRKYTVKKE
jgi:hypothetical protein